MPDGEYEGELYDCGNQPCTRLWFEEVDSGRWQRIVTTGPRQSGKTLTGSLVPLCYHLFEWGEHVIFLLPDSNMGADKWNLDIKPVIEASPFKDLLPTRGPGARGGTPDAIEFKNGAVLKFMYATASDAARAGFTARVLIVTEADKMDHRGHGSREGDKISQAEGCTESFNESRRIYLECTLTTEEGRTWREYTNGTASKVIIPCPHCCAWVCPEREHFHGYEDAEDVITARERSHFTCPECGAAWSEADRIEANQDCRLLHKGQTVDEDGKIIGPLPRTDTFGFRYTATNNMFTTTGETGAKEWRAMRDPDEDNAERVLLQYTWVKPHKPVNDAIIGEIDHRNLMQRLRPETRGYAPEHTQAITVGCDIGKRLGYWVAIAWLPSPHVLDYGVLEIPSDDLGEDRAILAALREWRDSTVRPGWVTGETGREITPRLSFVDAGNWQDIIVAFCQESGGSFLPTKGYGIGQQQKRPYTRPKTTGTIVKAIGEGYHLAQLKSPRIQLIEIDANHWKSFILARVTAPLDEHGALTLFTPSPGEKNQHLSFAKHFEAERRHEEFKPGKGPVIWWESIKSRPNHYLDATALACVAGHAAGIRLVQPQVARRTMQTRKRTSNPGAWTPQPIKMPGVNA